MFCNRCRRTVTIFTRELFLSGKTCVPTSTVIFATADHPSRQDRRLSPEPQKCLALQTRVLYLYGLPGRYMNELQGGGDISNKRRQALHKKSKSVSSKGKTRTGTGNLSDRGSPLRCCPARTLSITRAPEHLRRSCAIDVYAMALTILGASHGPSAAGSIG